jgi:hypothetical protein
MSPQEVYDIAIENTALNQGSIAIIDNYYIFHTPHVDSDGVCDVVEVRRRCMGARDGVEGLVVIIGVHDLASISYVKHTSSVALLTAS